MIKKIKSSPDKHSVSPSKMHLDDNPDKRNPNPDDPNEQTGPPIKEMPLTGLPGHPHHEEILDRIPE